MSVSERLEIGKELRDRIVELRREFHRHPELSLKEAETAKRVCRELERLGIPYRAGIGGHGIVADIPGERDSPFIALRSDMDALPITEETGLEFASIHDGVMHACGHDGHMSMLLGAAELLLREKKRPLPIRLIFEPAEEIGAGARAMCEAGALESVAMIFGGHIDRHYPTGTIMVTDGAVNASADKFIINICGEGGHGARPHESTDAVIVGSLMVMALQTIVSREVDPAFPSVISVGEFRAGTKSNVIAGEAQLTGTIRALHEHVREQLNNAVRRIAESICELHGARLEMESLRGPPPLINSEKMAILAREAAAQVIGEENVVAPRTVNMGSEDFSYYLEQAPGCYVRYGGQRIGSEGYPAHSSRFDFDEGALPVAAAYLCRAACVAAEKVDAQVD